MKAIKRLAAGRRKFLTGAGAAAGSAALGFPAIVKAQGPISMRWQSTWPTKDIFHEYAVDFAEKVNEMSGGDLRIEVLPAGAVVKAFDLIDAVSKGTPRARCQCAARSTLSGVGSATGGALRNGWVNSRSMRNSPALRKIGRPMVMPVCPASGCAR